MKKIFFSVLVCIFVLALISPNPAVSKPILSNQQNLSSSDEPPPPIIQPKINTKSEEALQRIATDIREAAKKPRGKQIFVSVLFTNDPALSKFFKRAAFSRPFGNLRWVSGEVMDKDLIKLASLPGVISVISTDTYKPVETPGEDEFKAQRSQRNLKELHALLKKGGKKLLLQTLQKDAEAFKQTREASKPSLPSPNEGKFAPLSVKVREIHGADQAQANGFTGEGVTVAVVDTGVDFGHPDLQGTQARIEGGAYEGWPFAYNTLSGSYYVMNPELTIGPDTYWDLYSYTWYAHTLPVEGVTCTIITCTANLEIDFGYDAGWGWSPVILPFVWPNTSESGQYYYTVHPDFNHLYAGYDMGLGYASSDAAPAAVIVSDETTAGVYDTVYVDTDFDQDLTNEKPMRKGDELAGADLFDANYDPGSDGVWDLSAGMLTWISDGVNPPPGVGTLYDGVSIPEAGRLLSFVGDEDGHGTNCAGQIAAQGIITDPEWWGPINPLFAGGENAGGAGGPVLAGMSPDAKIAAFQNGFSLPYDSWVLAALGFDGTPESSDEALIISNSWGASSVLEDGWDEESRFAHWLAHNYAPNATFLIATGNGGHGYGTVTSPDGGPIIDVGASTSYGSLAYFEFVDVDQFTWGAIAPWSNRGPTTLGDVAPDLVAVGAWGTGANPLNLYYGNGEAAYDSFGGTSMATPVAAGNLALLYQAFKETYNRWPTWQEAKNIFLNASTDLGYDVLTQGSGNANGNRATQIASGNGYWIEPAQWTAGNYRGTEYPAFPAILHPGQSTSKAFSVHNTSNVAKTINVQPTTLQAIDVVTYTLNYPSFSPSNFTTPTWLAEITDKVEENDPDLVRAQVIFPFSVFDTDENYSSEDRWRVLFYDWTDLNSDGDLWTDTNSNNIVDSGEIDNDILGLSEYNRYTYGYPSGNYLEASVGRDALSRSHDGVFIGLQRRSGNEAVQVKVQVTFYKKTAWSWITAPASVNVPANGSVNLNATLAVPAGTRPGVYAGALEFTGSERQIVPVVVHVAANSATFSFGATSLSEPPSELPYDNGHLSGGFDWDWRYESGDWKLFYFDIPNGTAASGKAMIVDTQWLDLPTDVDTWLFAAAEDFYSISDPLFYGPKSVQLMGGSNDTWLGNGIFTFDTATGDTREVVGGELRDGLGFISLHNVLYAGQRFNEPIVGNTYQVQTSPSPVVLTTTTVVNLTPPQFGGSWQQSFTTSRQIDEGISVLAFGLSEPLSWHSVNLSPGPTDCDWSYPFTVNQGGLIEATTSSSTINDIDLFLYYGSTIIASSTTATADEHIMVKLPADGNYELCVDNWSGTPGKFDLDLRVVQGNNLTVTGVPSGAVNANSAVNFTINYTTPSVKQTTWEGLLFIGPASAPTAIQVPVYITGLAPDILITAEKTAGTSTAIQGQTFTYTIKVTNQGTLKENVQVEDPLPILVEYVIGSQSASKGSVFYNLFTRTIKWNVEVNAAETVTLSFQVKAKSGFGWAENVAYISGQYSAQSLTTEAARTLISPYGLYLPLILRQSP